MNIKEILAFSIIFTLTLYLAAVGFIYHHELQNQAVFTKYGMESYIVLTEYGLHGHTYPVKPNCGTQPQICEQITKEIW